MLTAAIMQPLRAQTFHDANVGETATLEMSYLLSYMFGGRMADTKVADTVTGAGNGVFAAEAGEGPGPEKDSKLSDKAEKRSTEEETRRESRLLKAQPGPEVSSGPKVKSSSHP